MLKHLSIQNYALIERVEIPFDSGFSVITGETGAGKSILLGALNLLLGKRAENKLMKNAERKTIIEGEFDVSHYRLQDVFKALEIDYDRQTFLRREILPSGKSRAFINDTPVSLQQLKQLSSYLIDIHSQFATYELFDNARQLDVLTHYAEARQEWEVYNQTFRRFQQIEKEIEHLETEQQRLLQEKDYLEFLLHELEDAGLSEMPSLEELRHQINQLANAQEIKEVLFSLSSGLTENELSVENQLIELKQNISKIAAFSAGLQQLSERLNALHIEVQDLSMEAGNIAENIEHNPALLEQLQSKQHAVERLLQKHRCTTLDELQQKESEIAQQLLQLNHSDTLLEEKKSEREQLLKTLREQSNALSEKRRGAIGEFTAEIEKILQQTGIANACFTVQLTEKEHFSPTGKDDVEFYFSANKGKAPQPLKQVASGGELSRVMLAVKKIESKKKQLPTLIFDEIDTGVSGEISDKIGELLLKTARRSQVIAITHSPQIAAKAQHHWLVYKTETDRETFTQIKKLSDNERITELAKILSGNKISQTAIEHAKNLLVQ